MPELRRHVGQKKGHEDMLKRLHGPPTPRQMNHTLSTDSQPPLRPERCWPHHGTMTDRSGITREWNGRAGLGGPLNLNGQYHKLHCEYFDEPSIFVTAPSQRWRRHLEYKDAVGTWRESDWVTRSKRGL